MPGVRVPPGPLFFYAGMFLAASSLGNSVGNLACVEPVGARILALGILGESSGALAIVGMMLVFISLVLAALHVDERDWSPSTYS